MSDIILCKCLTSVQQPNSGRRCQRFESSHYDQAPDRVIKTILADDGASSVLAPKILRHHRRQFGQMVCGVAKKLFDHHDPAEIGADRQFFRHADAAMQLHGVLGD